jgi:hypothetical protein
MTLRTHRLFMFSLAFTAAIYCQNKTTEIHGVVLSAAGVPVQGALITKSVNFSETDPIPQGYPGTICQSDATGAFTLKAHVNQWPMAISAFNPDRTLGGMAFVDENKASEPVQITLMETQTVTGTVTWELPVPVELQSRDAEIFIAHLPENIVIGQCSLTSDKFRIPLPPGEFKITCLRVGYQSTVQNVKIPQAQKELTLEMKLTFIEKYRGKEPPPIKPTASLGVAGEFNIQSYKGKWVLLRFFGPSCDCEHKASLRNQIKLYNANETIRKNLQIIVVLDAEVKDFENFEKTLLAKLQVCDTLKEFPFPVIIDTTGKANEDYRAQKPHRAFLLDPEGKLVMAGMVLPDEIKEMICGKSKQP